MKSNSIRVIKVANGYTADFCWNPNVHPSHEGTYVFPTLRDLFAWMEDVLRPEGEAGR